MSDCLYPLSPNSTWCNFEEFVILFVISWLFGKILVYIFYFEAWCKCRIHKKKIYFYCFLQKEYILLFRYGIVKRNKCQIRAKYKTVCVL